MSSSWSGIEGRGRGTARRRHAAAVMGWEGRSAGRAREALMAGSGRSDGKPNAASAAVDRENRGGRERRKEEREKPRSTRFA